MIKMKKLNVGGVTYEIVDETARVNIEALKTSVNDLQDANVAINEKTASTIRKIVEGSNLLIHDVSPIEHTTVVKVKGENVLTYPFATSTKTTKGITFEDNGDGSIHIYGTATDYAVIMLNDNLTLEDGKTYKLEIESNEGCLFMAYTNESGETAWLSNLATNGLTWNNNYTYQNTYIQIQPNKSLDLTVRPALRYAIEPTALRVTCVDKQYTPNINGLVENTPYSLLSQGLSVNGENAVIECEYNADTKKYIDGKFAELRALIQ